MKELVSYEYKSWILRRGSQYHASHLREAHRAVLHQIFRLSDDLIVQGDVNHDARLSSSKGKLPSRKNLNLEG
jgi:hypothetical protein